MRVHKQELPAQALSYLWRVWTTITGSLNRTRVRGHMYALGAFSCIVLHSCDIQIVANLALPLATAFAKSRSQNFLPPAYSSNPGYCQYKDRGSLG